ncbi:hypothetical protein HY407_03135 [Candidatus Gottesmanbacteria bacterium]|nr:hypothetical protein [Candidatus Gottesmanbacteria bacterium]
MPDIFTLPDSNKTNSSPPDSPKDHPKTPSSGKTGLFNAFSFMPQNMHFDTQEPGETILLLLRRHWITNISWLFTGFLLLIIPIFIFPLFDIASLFPAFFPSSFTSFLILTWYILTASFLLTEYLIWYFNVAIVTQERIIDIDFAILYKSISETRISRVEDVTSHTGGFIRSFFDFGDVFVQTAANFENFEFLAVPHPQQVVKIINQLMGKVEEG